MDEQDGLIAAYALDGKGGGTPLDWQGLQQWRSDEGFLWVHLDFTHAEAQRWLRQDSGVDKVVCDALLADETRPRSTALKDGLLVMLRGVNTNPGADPEDMVALRLWVEDRRVITTRRRRLLSIVDVRESIDRGDGPGTPGELLVDLADRLVVRMADAIDAIEEEVDRLENEVVESERAQLRHELARMRMEVIGLRRYLSPQREAMARLAQERVEWLSDNDRIRLREITDRVVRYVEDLEAARDRAGVVQEELNNRLSEQMNNRMYVLSLVAAVFLPLGFLTGLLGINVGGIPGAEYAYGFEVVILFLVVLVGLQIWLFRRRRWL
ncbi:magnesium transporter CorA [Candidatus Tenderia electrophaga]|jgi:zinc transporter|uniref:Magnesium transporter CorA n=1 Tax=Candidatus Tenderia electrophaga TaxID=1748243 RepID=A0A0S2TE90_9GAMM|nr:magnesium transporter CorA [Candidatus Tenderia electrophaga]